MSWRVLGLRTALLCGLLVSCGGEPEPTSEVDVALVKGGSCKTPPPPPVPVCAIETCSKKSKVIYETVSSSSVAGIVKAGGASCGAGAHDCCIGPTGKTAICTDLKSDAANCGQCGVACATGQTCSAGACACPVGQTLCGKTCVDVTSDVANCGACGTACPTGDTCKGGACIAPCNPGETACAGICTVLGTDNANCGACGNVCPATNVCEQGTCVSVASTSACVPTSSLTVLLPPGGAAGDVNAYVPNGSWQELVTGVQLVPLEGSGTRTTIPTAAPVNSCAANAATGAVVCTANNTDVYIIQGSTLASSLTSGATGSQSFSGGTCENCGVAIDAMNNRAIITVGLSAGGPGGYQFLDLASNTFATPIPAGTTTSENILFDPLLNLVLSPNESNDYQLVDTVASTVSNFSPAGGGELDSAAEDCSTGIALASVEFTDRVVLVDLKQRALSANTWSAPSSAQSFPEFSILAAGTNGIAVAPGNSHLGVVTGEFGGAGFGVIQLPATSGSGTPAVVDYAAANVPNDPSGAPWQMGLDPHTVTAYTSPSTGVSLAVISNLARSYLALVDLKGLLAATRTAGTHSVDSTVDLVSSGVVRFVSIH